MRVLSGFKVRIKRDLIKVRYERALVYDHETEDYVEGDELIEVKYVESPIDRLTLNVETDEFLVLDDIYLDNKEHKVIVQGGRMRRGLPFDAELFEII